MDKPKRDKNSKRLIALIDYGIGNLRSVEKALTAAGAQVCLTSVKEEIISADKVVLPGVGAFGDGMKGLQVRGFVQVLEEVRQRRTPLLGICVGMQLLFKGSDEAPDSPGLGFLPGFVRRFEGPGLKVPQTGWNQILPLRVSPLLQNLPQDCYAYFNHGYYCDPASKMDWLATTDYGLNYASIVGHDNLYGVQFHPEKSQDVGLQILRNFVEMP